VRSKQYSLTKGINKYIILLIYTISLDILKILLIFKLIFMFSQKNQTLKKGNQEKKEAQAAYKEEVENKKDTCVWAVSSI